MYIPVQMYIHLSVAQIAPGVDTLPDHLQVSPSDHHLSAPCHCQHVHKLNVGPVHLCTRCG